MKRLLATGAILCAMAVASGPAMAAATNSYGSFKATWTVAVTSTVHLNTNIDTSANQSLGANTLSPSSVGVCASQASETAESLTFGTVVPASGAATGCLYKNAVGVQVTTNDSAGFKIQEMLDSAMPTGYSLCAFPNTPAAFGGQMTSAATVAASTHSGTNACTGGQVLTVGTGGAGVQNAGAGPGDFAPAGTNEYYKTAAGGTLLWVDNSAVGPTTGATPWLASEDIQLDMAANAGSGTNSAVVTVQYIAN